MREIKFRVWDKENKEFIQFNKMGFLEDGSLWYVQGVDENEEESDPPYFENQNDWELMQYTGLKDATGVEIYEGDICEEPYEEILGVVKFSEGKFIIVWDNSGDDLFEVSDEVRVVGNIYEHGYFVRGLEAE